MDKQLKLILKNGRNYNGKIILETDKQIKILDKFGIKVTIEKDMISERLEMN